MTTSAPKWEQLLCDKRRKAEARQSEPRTGANNSQSNESSTTEPVEQRTEIERDHDRILFCTPVRRLADKTQVFPLDRNDSVRNRLTHSHEVSNLARSFGVVLTNCFDLADECSNSKRDVPALLAAVGLVHDLGNPPFGHQGEAAIRSWFKDNEKNVAWSGRKRLLTRSQYQDFLKFEGNAQTFRLVTRLQLLNDNFGLDLTYATLAAMMKYPVGSAQVDNRSNASVAKKKHGFFESEREIANAVLSRVGLNFGKRHPLAYLMEACDDIAYAVLDIEDAIKKGLASFSDLTAYLTHHSENDALVRNVVEQSEEKHHDYRKEQLSPAELNDVSMQRFRVFAIGAMMKAATRAFNDHSTSLISGKQAKSLLALSDAKRLRELLGDFAKSHAFQHRSVLEIELRGYNTIRGLMDIFWEAIIKTDPESHKQTPETPFERYVFTRISENYRRIYQDPSEDVKSLPLRYRQCLLLTDMISGMTDSYAVNLLSELKSFKPV